MPNFVSYVKTNSWINVCHLDFHQRDVIHCRYKYDTLEVFNGDCTCFFCLYEA